MRWKYGWFGFKFKVENVWFLCQLKLKNEFEFSLTVVKFRILIC